MKVSGIISSILAASVLLCSCSVKEDRFQCPLYLFFPEGVNGVGAEGPDATVQVYERGSGVPTKTVDTPLDTLCKAGYYIVIRKGETVADVLVGRNAASVSGSLVTYPDGKPVDALYALSESFETTAQDETYRLKKRLGRQVTPVDLTLKYSGNGDYPFVMVLRSGWNGFDGRTLEPVRGNYHCVLATDGAAGHYTFRAPRQGTDTDLRLEFWEGDPDGGAAAEMLYSYDLGGFMTRGGYDWTEAHLKEYRMSLDYAHGRFTIAVNDWRDQFIIENYEI